MVRGSSEFESDLAACRALLRGGSRTFFMASLLLPRTVRDPASALYAFCRLADDIVDLQDRSAGAVPGLRQRLALAYAGRPLPIAADRALAEVVRRFAIPRALPEALLEGFAWDAEGRRYESFDDLTAYTARVAASVGAMMALLMGTRDADALAQACDLGVAMQLSNIARDVGEDARAGRLYLPLAWLREAGIDPDAFVAAPEFSPALGKVVRRLLDAAEAYYARATGGIARLPWHCRPGIAAARLLYGEIGRVVARRGCDSVARRAVVPTQRKLWLLVEAFALAGGARRGVATAPAAAARYLVDAAVALPAPRRAVSVGAWRRMEERVAWVCELFAQLERRESLRASRR